MRSVDITVKGDVKMCKFIMVVTVLVLFTGCLSNHSYVSTKSGTLFRIGLDDLNRPEVVFFNGVIDRAIVHKEHELDFKREYINIDVVDTNGTIIKTIKIKRRNDE